VNAREDERWQAAQGDYIAAHPDEDPSERLVRRILAARRMRDIETEHERTTA
jgi:hypothetical protein